MQGHPSAAGATHSILGRPLLQPVLDEEHCGSFDVPTDPYERAAGGHVGQPQE